MSGTKKVLAKTAKEIVEVTGTVLEAMLREHLGAVGPSPKAAEPPKAPHAKAPLVVTHRPALRPSDARALVHRPVLEGEFEEESE